MNILDSNICKAKHDLFFIPFSTEGFMQADFEQFLRENQLAPFIPLKAELGHIYPLSIGEEKEPYQSLILACTNRANDSSYTYIRNIIIQSAETLIENKGVKNIGIPLLGAGGGGLEPEKVLIVLEKTISEFWPDYVNVTYYHRDKKKINSLSTLNTAQIDRDSINLVFEYSIGDLLKAEWVNEFKGFDQFYYHLAREKLNEFLAFKQPKPNFFQTLYSQFTSTTEVYQLFLKNFPQESEENQFLKLCGELVAYIDRNAYNKLIWNLYPDKRTVARSGVNQTNWISNLIFFKAENNNFSTFTPNILNAINFLRFPDSELCMLSENHRKNIAQRIFNQTYIQEDFVSIVLNYFKSFSPLCRNKENDSILITRLLYTPELKILWFEPSKRRTSLRFPTNYEVPKYEQEETQSVEEVRRNNLKNLLHSDVYAEADLLNYEAYASVIATYLTSELTNPPLTIGIMAPWGKGKTSLMRFIEKKINRKATLNIKEEAIDTQASSLSNWDIWNNLGSLRKAITTGNKLPHPTIWFNAWKFQKNEQIWAGLAHEIITQLASKLTILEREKFYLRLNLRRVDEDKVRHTLVLNAISKLLIPFLLGLLVILLTFVVKWYSAIDHFELNFSPIFATEFLAFSALGAIKIIQYLRRQPGADLAKYVHHPDYKKDMGYYANVEADLKHALSILVDTKKPPIIFIDDLDRCSPGTISELIEAINLFISGDISSCYFVIGQDAQVIAASLDSSYDKIGEKLGNVVGKRHGSLGWYFMEKFIQLQFNLPVITEYQSKKVLQHLISTIDNQNLPDQASQDRTLTAYSKLESSIETIDDLDLLFTPERDQLEAEIMLFDPERVAAFNDKVISRAISGFEVAESALENVIIAAGPYLNNSPRIMKRFANLYIFYQSMKYSNTCKGLRAVSDEALTCWLLVMIRWPQLVRAIQWDNDKNFLTGNNAIDRAEDFELLIQESDGFDSYINKIKGRKIDENLWLTNEELFDYFKHKNPDGGKLSHAVVCGLW